LPPTGIEKKKASPLLPDRKKRGVPRLLFALSHRGKGGGKHLYCVADANLSKRGGEGTVWIFLIIITGGRTIALREDREKRESPVTAQWIGIQKERGRRYIKCLCGECSPSHILRKG